jgi:hypothetical protein
MRRWRLPDGSGSGDYMMVETVRLHNEGSGGDCGSGAMMAATATA